jgi:hypothetical protein
MKLECILAFAALLLTVGCAGATAKPWQQDRIIITCWLSPPNTDQALAAIKSEHYNLVWAKADELDVVARHGLRAMLQDPLLAPASLDDPGRNTQLDALIARVKDHPALEAYYLIDEPSAADFPGWGRLVAYLRERDPAHFAYINLFPTYASNEQLGVTGDTTTAYREHLRQFIEVVKPALVSYDHYHFFKHHDTGQYFLNLGLIRETALRAGVPFVNIIQACTILPRWRLPNAAELRWLVYTTLAYGGRGISYFLYWGPAAYGGLYQEGQRTPLALDAARLNAEIEALSRALMALHSLGVYHTAPLPTGAEAVPADAPVGVVSAGEFVLGLFGEGSEATAFMVVNRDYHRAATARLRLPRGARVQEFDRARREWRGYATPGDGATIAVSLEAGDGRLFRLAR